MNFKQWLIDEALFKQQQPAQQQQQQQPNWLGQTPKFKDVAKELGTMAVRTIVPGSDILETAVKLWQMHKQGKKIKDKIKAMLEAKDKSPGVPANVLDMDDRLSYVLSPEAKDQIADEIIKYLDDIIQQVQSGQMPQHNANTIAVQYLQKIIQQIHK